MGTGNSPPARKLAVCPSAPPGPAGQVRDQPLLRKRIDYGADGLTRLCLPDDDRVAARSLAMVVGLLC